MVASGFNWKMGDVASAVVELAQLTLLVETTRTVLFPTEKSEAEKVADDPVFAMEVPEFMYHAYCGLVPPEVLDALKVILSPGQKEVLEAVIETVGVCIAFTVIVNSLLVVLQLLAVSVEVITTLTLAPLERVLEEKV